MPAFEADPGMRPPNARVAAPSPEPSRVDCDLWKIDRSAAGDGLEHHAGQRQEKEEVEEARGRGRFFVVHGARLGHRILPCCGVREQAVCRLDASRSHMRRMASKGRGYSRPWSGSSTCCAIAMGAAPNGSCWSW